ncbi:hypothetical protein B5F40_02745 [Gordonibacter sp. An230]|uniref:nucleotidyltransferase domain-containing protein n=1 Tax=Gordonibacter sp. An230 TaxID=1965592 RepID=UPI000B3959B9|nr:nucleotidyltransferase domain-containing protein [Gordonibacter sp. An230]OUO91771.1 hypothetical protein B5F40_02745 [Gordonibacter sp. An230]
MSDGKINLPDSIISRIADSVAEAAPTDSIYNFRSYARGEEGPSSDVDIYAIASDETLRPLACAGKAREALLRMPQPRDVLAAPRTLFENAARISGRSKSAWPRKG